MSNDIVNTTDILQDYLDYIKDDTKAKKTPTYFNKLDSVLNGGLSNGLITIGAIPSLGKTTFMLQVADNMAQRENTKVLFFSLEMTRYDIITKSLSRLSHQINPQNSYTFNDLISNDDKVDYEAILEAYKPIANNLYIIDNLYDIREIEAYILNFKNVHPNTNIIVVVDYLQYILCKSSTSDKQVVDIITKKLKEISKANNITIIAISSLNRANYSNDITMESFKESGSIEYTSDILIGLEYTNNTGNDREYEARKNPRKISLKIIKNRYGALGVINYDFNTMYHTFTER